MNRRNWWTWSWKIWFYGKKYVYNEIQCWKAYGWV